MDVPGKGVGGGGGGLPEQIERRAICTRQSVWRERAG